MGPRWLDLAWDELGVAEIPGQADNPRIVEYHQSTSLLSQDDEVAWCSAFVNWCFATVDMAHTNKANARSWMNWGVGVAPTDPPIGSVVVLWRESRESWKGHVGFLVGANENRVVLLGGNQSNRVCVRDYPANRVLGVRWPG